MRINNLNNISFLKTIRGKGAIVKDGTSTPVSIFEYDKKEDLINFESLKRKQSWRGSYYLADMICFGEKYMDQGFKIHTLEDGKNSILAYAVSQDEGENLNILLLETAPKLSLYNSNRKERYIGETMVAFLAQHALSQGKNLTVDQVADRPKTSDFYFSLCKFSRLGDEGAILKRKTAPKLLQDNEVHTGKKIELIV